MPAWERKSPEVAIGVPFGGNVTPEWALQFSRLQKPKNTIYITEDAPAVDYAREDIVETFLETEARNLVFLDSDIIPPLNFIPRFLEHNLPVVSGVYYAKKQPVEYKNQKIRHPAAWRFVEDEGLKPVVDWREGSIIKVDCVGMGLCLIQRRVFEEMEPPYFRWLKGFQEHPWGEYAEETIGVSEDFYFCHRVRKELGMPIYLATGVEAQHEMTGTLGREGISERQLGEEI